MLLSNHAFLQKVQQGHLSVVWQQALSEPWTNNIEIKVIETASIKATSPQINTAQELRLIQFDFLQEISC